MRYVRVTGEAKVYVEHVDENGNTTFKEIVPLREFPEKIVHRMYKKGLFNKFEKLEDSR